MLHEYDSSQKTVRALEEFREIWRYRDLLKLLIVNSIKTRYKRSVLGVFWTLLNPLLNAFVLTIALSQLFRFELVNYPVYLLVGLLFWNFFAQTTQLAMHTLVWGSNILKRIYVPRTIFSLSVLGNGLVNFLLGTIPLMVIMLVMQHPIRPSVLLLPLALLLLVLFTLGFALLVSTMAVFFVDMVDLMGVILSALFYLLPIIYPITIIPEKIQFYFRLNPLNLMLEIFQSALYFGTMPSPRVLAGAAIVSISLFIVGWWAFTKKVDEFAYRI